MATMLDIPRSDEDAPRCPACGGNSAGSCRYASIRALLHILGLAYGGKCTLALVFGLVRLLSTGRASPAALGRLLLQSLLSRDSARFAATLGIISGSVRAIRCTLARFREKDDKLNAAVAGFIGSLPIALDAPERRSSLALYMLCRAVYSLSHTGMRLGHVPRLPGFNIALFALANMGIIYGFIFRPHMLDRPYYRWMTSLCGIPHSTIQWTIRDPELPPASQHAPALTSAVDVAGTPSQPHRPAGVTDARVRQVWKKLQPSPQAPPTRPYGHTDLSDHDLARQHLAAYVEAVQPPTAYRSCSVLWHPGHSCEVERIRAAPGVFLRCLRVYAPVHVIPAVLFHGADLLRNPLPTLTRVLKSCSLSALFLTTYVTVVTEAICSLRVARRRDTPAHAVLAGALGALGLFFENNRRASELMLYCMPKGLCVAFGVLEEAGWVSRVPGGQTLMFAAAIALMLATDRQDYNTMYASAMNSLFGADDTSLRDTLRVAVAQDALVSPEGMMMTAATEGVGALIEEGSTALTADAFTAAVT